MSIDIESANELMSSFEDHYEVIQVSLNKLIHNAEDAELINSTFRSIHTVKGNTGMMQIMPLVDYAHAIEETMGAMRSGYFKATPKLCDLILTAVDRLRDLHAKYIFNKEIAPIDETGIATIFNAMAKARTAEEVESLGKELAQLFSPNSEEETESNSSENGLKLASISHHDEYLDLSKEQAEDLLFFRSLALQTDEQNQFWHERTDLILYLVIKTAQLADRHIDLIQLVAGVYMHDIGMAFITDDIVNKKTRLNAMDAKKMQQHPIWGYNLLCRMDSWQTAADMVLQHHERIDGEGYPYRKKGDEICDGAKLLAIADAYYAMTNLRADRSHRRSIMRAISEVNACIDTQFDSYWVQVFNQVIRSEVKSGEI